MSARTAADEVATHSGQAEGQVALIVLLLLGGASALAIALRIVSRRSGPARAA